MIAVTLAGIEMNTGVADSDGALWYVTELEGWDSPDLRQETMDSSVRDGTVVASSIFGARSVSLRGICKAQGVDGYWDAYNRCCGLVEAAQVVDLVVSESIDKRLSVRRAGSPKVAAKGVGAFEFDWPLLATDPRKYAVQETVTTIAAGATVTVTNSGNAVTYPSFTTQGKVIFTNETTDLTLATKTSAGPGGTTVYATVPSGTVFDMNARTAYAGSDSQFGQVAVLSSWWGLVKGENVLHNLGDHSITLTHHDAWI